MTNAQSTTTQRRNAVEQNPSRLVRLIEKLKTPVVNAMAKGKLLINRQGQKPIACKYSLNKPAGSRGYKLNIKGPKSAQEMMTAGVVAMRDAISRMLGSKAAQTMGVVCVATQAAHGSMLPTASDFDPSATLASQYSGVLWASAQYGASLVAGEPLSIRETISPSALHDARSGPVRISGTSLDADVLLRVTTSLGISTTARVSRVDGKFVCWYPDDFAGATRLVPGMLFIDATTNADFNAHAPGHFQAEIAMIVHRGKKAAPVLPSVFTSDFLDSEGHRDQSSARWPENRALANLFMHSRAARLAHVGRTDFDLSNQRDLDWFKNNLTLYEFNQRDRDWSKPLAHRPARTFWQSVWNTWFNASNDHPLDGNPANRSATNYLPYAFANDFADVLIMELMRLRTEQSPSGHQRNLCREAARNLLAMQHRGSDNFALPEEGKKQEVYTAGAFRYGMFENGDFMMEGKGWFYNPKFRDFEHGGVLNGRAVWALGELLRHDPEGPLASQVRDALALALKFCLHDGAAGGYVKTTRQGNVYWRDVGEHAYLLLGMLAACERLPDMKVPMTENAPPKSLRQLCITSLDALVDLEKTAHQWTIYPNVDSMAVAALAQGARLLRNEPAAARWREAAIRVTDAWLTAKVDSRECVGAPIHFGLRTTPDRMTYIWPGTDHARFFYYQSGHWIHALADLSALTGENRYRDRAVAMVSDLCGNNPWQVRLLNELGAVYNWTDDINRDGIQDQLKQDLYPESTAFCQIGILRLTSGL